MAANMKLRFLTEKYLWPVVRERNLRLATCCDRYKNRTVMAL